MIKIEFKEVRCVYSGKIDYDGNEPILVKFFYLEKNIYKFFDLPAKITFGCPSELVPSREEILKQLGISPEEDEQNQIKWSKL